MQFIYRFYIYHALWGNTCKSDEYTRKTTITYKDPTITATDFTLTPTTSTCNGTAAVDISSTKSTLNGATFTWTVAGPFVREYNGSNSILLRPTVAYNPVTNKNVTVTVIINVPFYSFTKTISFSPVLNTIPVGSLTLGETFSSCTYFDLRPIVQGISTGVTPLKMQVTEGVGGNMCAFDLLSGGTPPATCPLMFILDQSTQSIQIYENPDFVSTLPLAQQTAARTYKVRIYSDNLGCVLGEATTTLTFLPGAVTTWGAGRLFDSANAANVGSSIATVPLDPNSTTDDVLYFINNDTKKLNRYTFNQSLNIWQLQELATPFPVLTNTTDLFKTNITAISDSQGNMYVYYLGITKNIVWIKFSPTGANLGSGTIAGTSFDYISARMINNAKYVFAHKADNSITIYKENGTIYTASASYYGAAPGVTYNMRWLPNDMLAEVSNGTSLQIRSLLNNWNPVVALSIPTAAKKIEFADPQNSTYLLYLLTTDNKIQYVSFNYVTNAFSSLTTVSQKINSTPFDFAVNPQSGTIYVGATVAISTPPGSYKILYNLWTDITSPSYSNINLNDISTNPGLGFYTYLHPHLYYVSAENLPRAFYNTWFSEGCTPPNARVATNEPMYKPIQELRNAVVLACVPNPISTTGNVQFSLPSDAYVQVEIFTMNGSRVSLLTKKLYVKGDHSVQMPENLSNGVYMIRLTTATESKFTRVVVQK